jgi:methionyl-tRNA formyltransferase
MEYIYVTENNLENRQTYQYSKYGGEAFLAAYESSRRALLLKFTNQNQIPLLTDCELLTECIKITEAYYAKPPDSSHVILRHEICDILIRLIDNIIIPDDYHRLDLILKTFEVRKRLYHCYDLKFKPYDESDYEDRGLYLLFACCLIHAYRKTTDLKYLNTLLKVNDLLISLDFKMYFETEYRVLHYALQEELKMIWGIR